MVIVRVREHHMALLLKRMGCPVACSAAQLVRTPKREDHAIAFYGGTRSGKGAKMSKEETFYIEEYKSLRQDVATKLKDRLEFNRWGLIALAALYSYIFSQPANVLLFWVPVGLSV